MIVCPNKSSAEWRELETALGSEVLAYAAYVSNNYEIPPVDQVRAEQATSQLEERLTGFLSGLGVSVEQYEDLRSVTGFDAVGATDLLYKTVLLKEGMPTDVLAKETAYVAYSFLGRKNKIRTDLLSSISQIENYDALRAAYQARNPDLSEYKLRELITVDFLADAIQNNWETPLDTYAGRTASYWSIKGNSKLEKKLRYHLARLKMWWNKLLGNLPLDRAGVEALANDIANDVLTLNFQKFGTELTPEMQQVHYDTTIAQDPQAAEITAFMQEQGLLLTGSLALRKEGTIYREPGETLHDLDFTMTSDLVQEQLSQFKNGVTLPVLGGLGQMAVPASDVANYMEANAESLLGQTDVVRAIRSRYPDFQIKTVFKGLKEGEYSMAGTIGDYAIDIFFVNDINIDQNEKSFQDWQDIFKAKIALGRAKDMRDFANYMPYHTKPDMLAQEQGLRHFNFERIAGQLSAVANEVSNYDPEQAAQADQQNMQDFGAWLAEQPQLWEDHAEDQDPLSQTVPSYNRLVLPEDASADQTVIQRFGEPMRLYHGSPNSFGKFLAPGQRGYQQRTPDSGGGIYFTMHRDEARDYGPHVKQVHVIMRNPYWWYGENRLPNMADPFHITEAQINQLLDMGHDGIVLKAENDLQPSGENDYVIAFSPVQIVDAVLDPVTEEIERNRYNPANEVSFMKLEATMPNKPVDKAAALKVAEREMANKWFGHYANDWLNKKHPNVELGWDEKTNPPVFTQGGTYVLTNREHFDIEVSKYLDNTFKMDLLNEQVNKDADYLTKMTDTRLREIYNDMTLKYGELERKTHGMIVWKVGNELGDRMIAKQLDHIEARMGKQLTAEQREQGDINWFQMWTQSIADFDVEQAGIQDVSRKISRAATLFKRESFEEMRKLSNKMTAVHNLYYAMKPKSWREKFSIFSRTQQANAPFEFLFERDGYGVENGRFISFTAMSDLLDAAKAHGVDSPEYKLAKAQTDLYHYINTTFNGLFDEVGVANMAPNGHPWMPHTSMDVYEEYSRSGLFGAWVELMGNEYRQSIGNIMIDYKGETLSIDRWKDRFKGNNQVMKKIKGKADTDMVDHLGEHKTVAEWKEYYKYAQDATAPFKLNQLIKRAKKKVANGTGGSSAHEAAQELANFNTSGAVPMRYLSRRYAQGFSVNAHKILSQSIKHLVFKKHHDKIMPDLHAIHAHYGYKKHLGGEAMEMNMKFIEKYANRYMYGEKDEFGRSWMGRLADRLNATTVMAFLAASPATSAYNLGNGLIFATQDKIARDGWVEGSKKMQRGMARMLGHSGSGPMQARLTQFFRDGAIFDPKAQQVMELYQVHTFARPDIERHNDKLQGIQDKLMWLQTQSEAFIRGASFLGEMTEEQWESFEMSGGQLVNYTPSAPTVEQVSEWMDDIGRMQGDYSVEHRRNYSTVSVFRFGMLFRGWLPDYLQKRFRQKWVDRNGRVQEGYYITAAKMIPQYRRYIQHLKTSAQNSPLEKHEIENFRRIVFDAAWMLLLFTASAMGGGDRDKRGNRDWAQKLAAQLFLAFHPRDFMKMILMPFPSLTLADKFLASLEYMMHGEFEKGGEQLLQITPGNRIIGWTQDNVLSEDDEE